MRQARQGTFPRVFSPLLMVFLPPFCGGAKSTGIIDGSLKPSFPQTAYSALPGPAIPKQADRPEDHRPLKEVRRAVPTVGSFLPPSLRAGTEQSMLSTAAQAVHPGGPPGPFLWDRPEIQLQRKGPPTCS